MTPDPAAPSIHIGRLVLEAPGLDAAGAERLATKVAAHLARAGQGLADVAIPRLEVVVSATDAGLDPLARRIADAVLRAG